MQKHEGEEFNGFFVVQFLPWNWNNPPLLFFFKDKKWGACMPLTHHINICWLLSFKFYWHIYAEPYMLGELKYITASGGWNKNYPWYMVHFIFFRNKTFSFVKIESWNFQQLFDLGFRETLQKFSSFRQTFRWHFCMGNKELSK